MIVTQQIVVVKIKSAKMFYIAKNPTSEITQLEPDMFAPSSCDIEGDILDVAPAAVCAVELDL